MAMRFQMSVFCHLSVISLSVTCTHLFLCVCLPLLPLFTATLLHTCRGDIMCRRETLLPSHTRKRCFLVPTSHMVIKDIGFHWWEITGHLWMSFFFFFWSTRSHLHVNTVVPVPSNVTFKLLVGSPLPHCGSSRICNKDRMYISVYCTWEGLRALWNQWKSMHIHLNYCIFCDSKAINAQTALPGLAVSLGWILVTFNPINSSFVHWSNSCQGARKIGIFLPSQLS